MEETTGCTVYDARPVQCVTYPFWTHLLVSEGAWKNAAQYCPGMKNGLSNTGEFYNKEIIVQCVTRYEDNTLLLLKG
jgi:Fe-S-cluster containining protein